MSELTPDATEQLLSRISENTRMTRQYVGLLALIAVVQAALIAAWLLGAIVIEFEPAGF